MDEDKCRASVHAGKVQAGFYISRIKVFWGRSEASVLQFMPAIHDMIVFDVYIYCTGA